jgi:hypothetical protein
MKSGIITLLLVLLVWPQPAGAQDEPSQRRHQVTVGGGVGWSGPYNIGDATAQLRGNGIGSLAPVFTLFAARSRITPTISPELRVGYAVTATTAVEFSFGYALPHVAVAISNDPEAPAQQLPGEQLQQYLIGGAATWRIPMPPRVRARVGNRLAPFVLGGATFLRQLHEDRTLGATGQVYYAGGGARYFLRRDAGSGRAYGLRADGRVNVRRNGIEFEDKMRLYPTVSLAAFIGF